ncbi:MAG: hypothetical protein ACJ786_09130, partial [Catenulispora sp.]
VRRPRLLGAGGEVTVAAGARVGERVIGLRKVTILDLPVLLALPELDNWDLPGTTTVHHDTPTTDPMAAVGPLPFDAGHRQPAGDRLRRMHRHRGEHPQPGLGIGRPAHGPDPAR